MTPKPRLELADVALILKPHLRKAWVYALIAGLLALMPQVYMLEVYGRVVTSRSHMTLAMLTVLVLISFCLMEVFEWVRSEILREAGGELDSRLASRVFDATYLYNLKQAQGSVTQPMTDLRILRDFLCSPVVGAAMEVPVAILFLGLLYALSPLLGAVTTFGVMLQVGLTWLNEKTTQPPLVDASRQANRAQHFAEASIQQSEVIDAMGMLGDIHGSWKDLQSTFIASQQRASISAAAFQAASKFVQVSLSSSLLGLGAWLTLGNQLAGGPGMMIVASLLGGRVLAPLVQVISQWRTVVMARDAKLRLDNLLSEQPVQPPSMALPRPNGSLTVENLVATAPGSTVQILKGLNFTLKPGEVVAVIGPSASGKTTLARLLVGLWPAMSGKVRLDGVDVFAWNKSELGPHLGYLPQGVELLEGTFAENISRFGDGDQSKLEDAVRLVGLHELMASLPHGYESFVGADGATLSGGQRQRVGLARALYGRPHFVVLDEPNSSLDEEGDAALAKAIQTLKQKGCTFVVMTHRTSVLAVADKILLLRDGVQQAFGPRNEVLSALNQAVKNAKPEVSAK